MGVPDTRTPDGFDVQMQTNHLSHFLLTLLLRELLEKTEGYRVICLSSVAAAGMWKSFQPKGPGKIDFDDLMWKTRKYDPLEAYAQSKLANVMHATELS